MFSGYMTYNGTGTAVTAWYSIYSSGSIQSLGNLSGTDNTLTLYGYTYTVTSSPVTVYIVANNSGSTNTVTSVFLQATRIA
jgi:hypothetical protein